MLENIANFEDKSIISLTLKYLQVLEYTPLRLSGVNLNYTLSEINISALEKVLVDPYKLSKRFVITPISYDLSLKKSDGKRLSVETVNVSYFLENDIKNNIRFSLQSDTITINNNFEIRELDRFRERINMLDSEYLSFLKINAKLIDSL